MRRPFTSLLLALCAVGSSLAWSALPQSPHNFTVLAVSRGTLWAGTYRSGVLRSRDGGLRWRPAGLRGDYVAALAARSGYLYAAAQRCNHQGLCRNLGIFLRKPGGRSGWLPAGLAGRQVTAISISLTTPFLLDAATLQGVYGSRDGGARWKLLLPQPALSLQVNPADSNQVLVGTAGQGLWYTEDGGVTWTLVRKKGLWTAVAYNPLQPGELLAGRSRCGDSGCVGDVFVSYDGGKSFAAAGIPGAGPAQILVGAGGQLVVRTFNNGLYLSAKPAPPWRQEQPSPDRSDVTAAAFWDHQLLASYFGRELYRGRP